MRALPLGWMLAGMALASSCAATPALAERFPVTKMSRMKWDPATLPTQNNKPLFRLYIEKGPLDEAGVDRICLFAAKEWFTFGSGSWPASGEGNNPKNDGMRVGKFAGDASIEDHVMNDGDLWNREKIYMQGAINRSFNPAEKAKIADQYGASFANGVEFTITHDKQDKKQSSLLIYFTSNGGNQVPKKQDGTPDFAAKRQTWEEGSTRRIEDDDGVLKHAVSTIDNDPTIEDFQQNTIVAKTWFLASDTDNDNMITNKDAKPNATNNEVDLYSIVKHEIGHAFGFEHTTTDKRREEIKVFKPADKMSPAANSQTKDVGAKPKGNGELSFGDVEMYFASDRAGGYGGLDLWSLTWDGERWGAPRNLGPAVNTSFDETMPFVDEGNGLLLFSSNRDGSFDLFRSTLDDSTLEWRTPIAFPPPINSSFDETSPVLDPISSTLVFASNRPGGQGGMDLWWASFVSGVTWSSPVNLGPSVNSTATDTDPVVSPYGSFIYFSSNRAGGSGGYDLWQTAITDSGDLTTAQAVLGANTSADEMAPGVSTDDATVYFSRNGGATDMDLVAMDEETQPTAVLSDDGGPASNLWLRVFRNPIHAGEDAKIRLGLPSRGEVSVEIYDLRGRRVATLARGMYEAGDHELHWDGKGEGGHIVPAGVYLVRVTALQRSIATRVTVLK